MKTIRKTGKKATYFEGNFQLRDNSQTNWAHPIDFPTIFTAYGQGIKSGNWQSCTAINTPDYVIEHYFDGKESGLKQLWEYCRQLEKLSYDDVKKDKDTVLNLVNAANNCLNKLTVLS